ncbi:hypothetical protein LTR84_011247 [Exophiala bonariae]|uniref:DUF4387 domain-containing protein n=1 Tax=Exophiala bonariae TaxID=1690606 RepID=A0AAV9MUT5_9EURO|nr:hypothetical protein LTR84_011247 [Exophiala bonariae]
MAPSAVFEEPSHPSHQPALEPICQIVTPVGMFGYGFNEEWTEASLAVCAQSPAPTALILDSGSTDSGPSKLALGSMTCPYDAYMRDFRKLIALSIKYHTPIILSSAGGDGSDEHVNTFQDMVREIAAEEANKYWKLKVVSIYSEVDKSIVRERLENGAISGCGASVPKLTNEIIDTTPRIVAQTGPEPYLDAMIRNPDFHIMIGGRAYDPAPYVAFAAYHALEPKHRDIKNLSSDQLGGLYHMGKILECGGLCATPKGLGAMGIVNSDFSVDIRPLDPMAKCVPLSVAAHTLYEKTRPDLLPGPGGALDVSTATYTPLEDSVTTRVAGSKFSLAQRNNQPFTVKLEGARVTGFRTLMMGSFGDPILISYIHPFLAAAKDYARTQNQNISGGWDIGFHVYGFDRTRPEIIPSQIFVVTETLAPTQKAAANLASAVRVHFAHGSYPGQKATSGNFGMGIGGKFEIEVGECTEFSVYHLMSLTDEEEHAKEEGEDLSKALFRWSSTIIGDGTLPDYQIEILTNHKFYQTLPVLKAKHTDKIKAISPAGSPRTLFDIAKVIRSKNSGPFEVTLDVMFDNPSVYKVVKSSDLLSQSVVAKAYTLSEKEIVWAGFFDPAMAFKATFSRMRRGLPSCSGGFMEDDVHGSQFSAPLRSLPLSERLLRELSLVM